MDFLQTFSNDEFPETVSSLIESGFTEEQANNFIPKVSNELIFAAGDSNGDVSTILGKININGLASKLGIDHSLVSVGLHKLLPMAMGSVKGSSTGNLAGTVKNLF